MRTAEIVSRPFQNRIGDGFCEKWSDVAYADDCDHELLARVQAWQDAQRVREARKPVTVHFNTMAAALQRAGR